MAKTSIKRRGPRADSIEFAKAVAEAATLPPLMPLMSLSDGAQKHWPREVGAKRRELWTPGDLDTAGRLCELLAKIDMLWEIMRGHPPLIKDAKGRFIEHPALTEARELERDVQSLRRGLQINSVSVNGPSHHLAGKNQQARIIDVHLSDDDDLFG